MDAQIARERIARSGRNDAEPLRLALEPLEHFEDRPIATGHDDALVGMRLTREPRRVSH